MDVEVDLNGKCCLTLTRVCREIIAPKTGWSGSLRAGQFIRATDVRGKQAADFWAFNAHDIDEHLSAMHTRVWVSKLCPKEGESFHTNHRRPILQAIADTCGVHDLMTAACDEHRYRLYGVPDDHPSCAGNLRLCMMKHFHGTRFYVPQPFNMFMNVRAGWRRRQRRQPFEARRLSHSEGVDRRIAISACPQEFNNAAGWYPSEIEVEILEPRPS